MRYSTHFSRSDKTPNSAADDRQLIRAIVNGDRAAFVQLYNRYHPRLFRFLHRMSRDYGLAEEVANDVMLVVWRTAHGFRGSSKVSTWILGIGYRQCLKKLKKRRIPHVDASKQSEVAAYNSDSVELDELVALALQELTAEHRMMIESVLYLGMTYREAAELAGCPVNTAKTRVHVARKRLRAKLMEMGYRYGEKIE